MHQGSSPTRVLLGGNQRLGWQLLGNTTWVLGTVSLASPPMWLPTRHRRHNSALPNVSRHISGICWIRVMEQHTLVMMDCIEQQAWCMAPHNGPWPFWRCGTSANNKREHSILLLSHRNKWNSVRMWTIDASHFLEDYFLIYCGFWAFCSSRCLWYEAHQFRYASIFFCFSFKIFILESFHTIFDNILSSALTPLKFYPPNYPPNFMFSLSLPLSLNTSSGKTMTATNPPKQKLPKIKISKYKRKSISQKY